MRKFKVGDRVINKSNQEMTVTGFDSAGDPIVLYDNGREDNYFEEDLELLVDPRDAEIEQLKDEIKLNRALAVQWKEAFAAERTERIALRARVEELEGNNSALYKRVIELGDSASAHMYNLVLSQRDELKQRVEELEADLTLAQTDVKERLLEVAAITRAGNDFHKLLKLAREERDALRYELEQKCEEARNLFANLQNAEAELESLRPKPVVKEVFVDTKGCADSLSYQVQYAHWMCHHTNLKLTFIDGKLTGAEVIK